LLTILRVGIARCPPLCDLITPLGCLVLSRACPLALDSRNPVGLIVHRLHDGFAAMMLCRCRSWFAWGCVRHRGCASESLAACSPWRPVGRADTEDSDETGAARACVGIFVGRFALREIVSNLPRRGAREKATWFCRAGELRVGGSRGSGWCYGLCKRGTARIIALVRLRPCLRFCLRRERWVGSYGSRCTRSARMISMSVRPQRICWGISVIAPAAAS